MASFQRHWPPFCLALIFLLQFAIIPWLGDMDKAGKLFLFCFFVLLSTSIFLKSTASWKVSSASLLVALFWVVLFTSALQAFEAGWSLLQVAILGNYILFLLMVCHVASINCGFFAMFINTMLLLGVVMSALGLYEFFHFHLFGPSSSMLIPYILPPDPNWRIDGPYGQPNLSALLLTVSLLAFFYKYLHRPTVSRTVIPSFFRFVPFILVGLVFFQTGSRAGLLSFSLVFGLLLWLVARGCYLADDRNGRIEFIRLVLCLAIAFTISKYLPWFFAAEADPGRSLGAVDINTDGRFVFWTSAFLIFLDHPWLGVGLDNYQFFQNGYGPLAHGVLGFVQYQAMGSTKWAHNELLQILSEGGVFAFGLLVWLIVLLLLNIWKKFTRRNTRIQPVSLYSHIFLLPFIIQSFFEWPFRHPPILALFFLCLGILFAQYPLHEVTISRGMRIFLQFSVFLALTVAGALLFQEVRIGSLARNLRISEEIDHTLDEFQSLADNPYSRHRVLAKALPRYARVALARQDDTLARRIVPFYERLTELEGARWQWYHLALLYFKVGREEDARSATQRTIDLMPSDDRIWAFLHYLNARRASRETGQPLDYFLPKGDVPLTSPEALNHSDLF